MGKLTGGNAGPAARIDLVDCTLTEIGQTGPIAAALWLYIDELDRSHQISQQISTPTGSFWHGIMHRREGDFPNSHYWFRKAGEHPAMTGITGYDPHQFIDAVAADGGRNNPELVALQRQEWFVLFEWIALENQPQ